jgi:predicted GNAT superfamily acetyltransferase
VNSHRVDRRLSRQARTGLNLDHYLAAGIRIINSAEPGPDGFPRPPDSEQTEALILVGEKDPLVLLEIPADIQALKAANMELALAWRLHTRTLIMKLFNWGYLVTDFVYLPGSYPRSYYVLSHGEQTL